MSDLIDFVRAQLDEDERDIRQRQDNGGCCSGCHCGCDTEQRLREVEAKRRILARCEDAYRDQGIWGEDGQEQLATDTMKLLALSYADRPGYREEWRP